MMPSMRSHGLGFFFVASCTLSALGCESFPVEHDVGVVCLSTQELEDGTTELVVEADSRDCASDHEDATFSCEVVMEDEGVRVSTRFQDGKDPNDGCAAPLTDTCHIAVAPGEVTVIFGDESLVLMTQSEETTCLPQGALPPGE